MISLLISSQSLSNLKWCEMEATTCSPALVQRMVGLSRPLAEHWMVISLSSSRHWEGWGVGVNLSFSATQVKTTQAYYIGGKHKRGRAVHVKASFVQLILQMNDTELMRIMFRHIQGDVATDCTHLMSITSEVYLRLRSYKQGLARQNTDMPGHLSQ